MLVVSLWFIKESVEEKKCVKVVYMKKLWSKKFKMFLVSLWFIKEGVECWKYV